VSSGCGPSAWSHSRVGVPELWRRRARELTSAADGDSVAILDVAAASVAWHDPTLEKNAHELPGVQGFSYHPLALRDRASDPVDPRVWRPITRGVRRLRSFQNFTRTQPLRLGHGAFCSRSGSSSSPSVSVFVPVCIRGRAYHVHLRGVDALPRTIDQLASVDIVTGCCLFSASTLRVTDLLGAAVGILRPETPAITVPVSEIASSSRLSFYELESACRLPRVTAEMAAIVPRELPVSVTIDVPRVQYYLYLLDAFNRKLVTPALMLRWFELVDERSRVVEEILRQRLACELSTLEHDRLVPVRRAANMDHLEPAVRDSVHSGSPLEVDRMCGLLAADDPAWRSVLRAVRPASYRDLINLSYVIEQLRGGGLEHHDPEPRLGIAVDNFVESRIFEAARAVAARIPERGRGSLLGVYPLERGFSSDATGKSDVYDNDPGDLVSDHAGRQYDATELLAKLYPGVRLGDLRKGVRTDSPRAANACVHKRRAASRIAGEVDHS
jgi:hypothetical protein